MDDQFKAGFGQMLAEMPEAPTWERVSAHRLTPERKPGRLRGPLVVLVSFVVTVVAVVAGVIVVRGGGSDTVGGSTVAYVKLAWSQDVVMRCQGLATVDNDGFDRATIEIWGPNANGLVRIDATAPDGTVERLVVEPDPTRSFPIRAWSSYEDAGGADTVFRSSECLRDSPGGSSSFAMASPPILPDMHGFGLFFTPVPPRGPDGGPSDFVEGLARNSTVREDEWRGVPVTVFEWSNSGIDELGAYEFTREIWFDAEARRYERAVYSSDQEVLGTETSTIEVLERDVVSVGAVSFSVDDLTLRMDRTLSDAPDEQVVTTTSIVPTALPLMADAVEIDSTDISTSDLSQVIDPLDGDQLFLVSVEDDQSLIVRLRAGARPHMFAEACPVLTSTDLPAGWDGTCLERVVDGNVTIGVFSYDEVSGDLGNSP